MSARYFLDTNIFVYCFDRQDRHKQKRAEEVVEAALSDHRGIISTQVVQEFLNVATTKFTRPMKREESRAYLETVLAPLCEVFPTIGLYREAIALQAETGYSFYDALVIAAALESDCAFIYSEDLQQEQKVRTLRIENPFRERAQR